MTEKEFIRKFCVKCKQPRNFVYKKGYKVCPVCGIRVLVSRWVGPANAPSDKPLRGMVWQSGEELPTGV